MRREIPDVSKPRPVERNERPVQVERPQRVERSLPEQSNRVERQEYSRPQAPVQRESFPRQPQVQRPSGGNSNNNGNSGGLQRGGRPGR